MSVRNVTWIGTVPYMSPEKRGLINPEAQINQQGQVQVGSEYCEFKADVFSLGLSFLSIMIHGDVLYCNQNEGILSKKIAQMEGLAQYDPFMKNCIKHMLTF